MRNKTLFLFLLTYPLFITAQDNTSAKTDSIVTEGKLLYRSEMASWYGTDIFLAAYKDKSNIGGYLSYTDGDTTRCIFYSKAEPPAVIGTISFDDSYNPATARTDLRERTMTTVEKELHGIRTNAFSILSSGDSLFKFYKNSNPNLIPLISNGQRKVYILTGPQQSGVVIFGNDYLLLFNDKNELVSKKELHKNIIITNYKEDSKDGKKILGGVHSHLPSTGDFMTATDVCTLMLYSRFAGWSQYYVISEKYMNIWDCEKNSLFAMTREAWDRISKDQENKKD